MSPLSVLAQYPLEKSYDGIDPLHWLPAWRWTRVNDIWSHRGGGLFDAIKNAGLGILDIWVNGFFFLASLLWEITTTMLSWTLTPSLFQAFEDVVDTTGLRLLEALGFTDATSGASVFAAIVVLAVVVSVMRFARNPMAGVKTLLRSFLPLAACAVLVGTTVAEINRAAYQPQWATTGSVVPGSLKWVYRTLDSGRSLLVAGVVESATLFSSVGDPPGTIYGCDSYLLALEDLYRQDAQAAGWTGAQIETPIVVSRMWQAVYLDQFSAAQVGVHSSKRAGCWTAEVRESSVTPIEIFAVWDHTCTLDDDRHHLYGCVAWRPYDSEQIQRAEAVFSPSDFDDHEWRSALTLWAVCDWRGRPHSSTVGGRNDLSSGAQRTLREMANLDSTVPYDGRDLAMLASSSGREVVFDPAFVGLRNARDSDQYLSAEACAAYRFEHPEDAGRAPDDADRKVKTPNEDRDGAWGLWAKWVTDRANIEPDDGADSRRHALGMSLLEAPDAGDRAIQRDTVDSINGSSWSGRLMYSAVAVITAALYGFSLAGMGLGTLIAQFIVGGIVAVLPLLLVLMALPVQAAQQLPRKVFKLLIMSLFAHLIFLLILSLVMMCIGILNQVLGGLTGNHLVRSMLFSVVPLIALFSVGAITKQFGLKITSIKGAALATMGIALAGMRPPSVPLAQYANRARSRYGHISDRSDVNRETRQIEARSGESGVRTQPRMRAPAPDQPALALNSKSSPAAIAAGALATMGGRVPRGASRGPALEAIPKWPAPPATPARASVEPASQGAASSQRDPQAMPTDVPADALAPAPAPVGAAAQVAAPEPDVSSPLPARGVGGLGGRIRLDRPSPVADAVGGEQVTRTHPQPRDPADGAATGTTGDEHTETGDPARRHRLTEPVESAVVRAGRAARAAQWGTLKAGRWVRDHRRAIKRVALGSIVAMGAVGMSAAATPLAVGYAGAKFIGWRYRRRMQALHLVRAPEERAQERFDRRQQRETRRQDREMRVEQRARRRAEERASAQPPGPPTSVEAPRHDRPSVASLEPDGPAGEASADTPTIPEFEPAPNPDPAPTPQVGSPTEMTTAQSGYLANLSESSGLDPSAVFEAVAGNRVRASEAIDVLRSGAPPDETEGTLMDRVVDATSRVRLPPQPGAPTD